MRLPGRLSRSWTAYLGVGLVLALFASFALMLGGGGESELRDVVGTGVSASELAALRIGASRDDVEDALGPGEDALDYSHTGTAVEPIDADCTYYTPDSGLFTAVIQLCYRDDRLVSKRRYEAPPGLEPGVG